MKPRVTEVPPPTLCFGIFKSKMETGLTLGEAVTIRHIQVKRLEKCLAYSTI